MFKRRYSEQTQSREEILRQEAKCLREQATLLPHGAVRDATIHKARQADTRSHLRGWLRSPGLQPPS